MRHQPAVGVHPFLDVGQVAAFADAVKAFGAARLAHRIGESSQIPNQPHVQTRCYASK
jgi:hypothetical protein